MSRFTGTLRKLVSPPHPDEEPADADRSRVANWLRPAVCLLDAEARDREQALRIAANTLSAAQQLDPTRVFDALWRREQAASTALGEGFAIPHARLAGMTRPVTLFVRLRTPIAFGAGDGRPVSFLLVILVPRDGADHDHLRMLAMISEIFSRRCFAGQIAAASDAAAADAVFQRAIARISATGSSTGTAAHAPSGSS